MSFFSWLGIRRASSGRVKASAPRRSTCRLRVERLEDRTVPASYSAATVPELIADIKAANLTPEADTITLAAGATYTLTAVNNNTDGPNGLPTIAAGENLTVVGNGAIIERSTASGTPAFRLFDVAAGAALTLQNMTLQGGLASGFGLGAAGGAVYSMGNLVLDGVTVRNNQVLGVDGWRAERGRDGGSTAGPGGNAWGGGLYIGSGTTLLTGSTISGNTAQGGKGGDGVNNKDFGGNGGSAFGGGLFIATGTITLHGTAVTWNTAAGGAAGRGIIGLDGQGIGGGLFIDPAASAFLDVFTVDHLKRNKASTSDPNIHGSYTLG